jgi:hypothetical protein
MARTNATAATKLDLDDSSLKVELQDCPLTQMRLSSSANENALDLGGMNRGMEHSVVADLPTVYREDELSDRGLVQKALGDGKNWK